MNYSVDIPLISNINFSNIYHNNYINKFRYDFNEFNINDNNKSICNCKCHFHSHHNNNHLFNSNLSYNNIKVYNSLDNRNIFKNKLINNFRTYQFSEPKKNYLKKFNFKSKAYNEPKNKNDKKFKNHSFTEIKKNNNNKNFYKVKIKRKPISRYYHQITPRKYQYDKDNVEIIKGGKNHKYVEIFGNSATNNNNSTKSIVINYIQNQEDFENNIKNKNNKEKKNLIKNKLMKNVDKKNNHNKNEIENNRYSYSANSFNFSNSKNKNINNDKNAINLKLKLLNKTPKIQSNKGSKSPNIIKDFYSDYNYKNRQYFYNSNIGEINNMANKESTKNNDINYTKFYCSRNNKMNHINFKTLKQSRILSKEYYFELINNEKRQKNKLLYNNNDLYLRTKKIINKNI